MLLAAYYGYRRAFVELATDNYCTSFIERWFWIEECTKIGIQYVILGQIMSIESQIRNSNLYYAGKALRLVPMTFTHMWNLKISLESYNKAIIARDFFIMSNTAACAAVDMWTLIGYRLRLYKDVRRMIADLIWNEKDEW